MTKTAQPMVLCTQCDGDGHTGMDEEGKYYSCYRCSTTGWITKHSAELEAADAARADQEHSAEITRERKRLGVPDGWSYYWDDYDGELVLVPPKSRTPHVASVGDDDIPF